MELSTVVKCIGNASLAAYASTTHSLSDDGQGVPREMGSPIAPEGDPRSNPRNYMSGSQTRATIFALGPCSCAPTFFYFESLETGSGHHNLDSSWWIGH
ncbi:hypothetical protein HNY73_002229 [Argiope bruennichi]|uniref:Uncharacterized protein n=1 Tax=Argiope bruennichi TaxID=94029 RepID=A0A8T0FX55_ARGBR|nr:hypothetical protein HNY73_002229 [Argiope bruennichi]